MKTAAVVAFLAIAGASGLRTPQEYKYLFNKWTMSNGKAYKTNEEQLERFQIFQQNVDKIEAHNAGNHTWTMAVNEFADLTSDEFAARYIGGLRPSELGAGPVDNSLLNAVDLPAEVDWVKKGAVTHVKNQGQCGSCWSFSTTGAVEGVRHIHTGKLESLSEQQLMDCSTNYGNHGCNGGNMDDAFRYIVADRGLCSEKEYPYVGRDTACHSCHAVATIHGHANVPARNVQAFKAAIHRQPISVYIEADQHSFQFYHSGILTAACGTKLDHGVLAVGYGPGYWLVKNSWGASWGEKGYIRLGADDGAERSRYNGGGGQCGILEGPCFPTRK